MIAAPNIMFHLTGQRIFQGKIDTLSPIEQLEGVSKNAKAIMIVGSQDKVAPPRAAKVF